MQPNLPLNIAPTFDGPSLEPSDQVRLAQHLRKVIAVMADGKWHTLREIAEAVGCSEASGSARLRDLRRTKHGAFTVNRKRQSAGVWLYQVLP